jgi:tryptophanyl-tRNA synthetase
MRPTGRLHIGHYFGALENWVKLQNDPQYECFFFVADWHALTSDYADTSQVAQNTIEIATDWLASGLDPAKSTLFLQSSVPEHAELNLLLSMVTPLGWLERVPTYKEALDNVKDKDLHTYGFLGYPVLQTADIVIYSNSGAPLFVPVGEDQVSHVEISREVVRRFNTHSGFVISEDLFLQKNEGALRAVASIISVPQPSEGHVDKTYWRTQIRRRVAEIGYQNFLDKLRPGRAASHGGFGSLDVEFELKMSVQPEAFFSRDEALVEPNVMLTKTPRIPGLDGRKMSKSYGNAITLGETSDEIRKKTKVMVTDPARKRRTDPGNPDICPVYDWHKLFSTPETLAWSAAGCRSAGIGCIECKMAMADNLIKWIEPVRARREEYAAHPDKVLQILDDGSLQAREVAQKTMARVREAVFHWKEKREEISQQKSSAQNAKVGD